MNWAEEPDPAAGDESYTEPDPGMDEAAYDEAGDYDTDDEALAGDEPAADGEGEGDTTETDAEADAGLDDAEPEPDADTSAEADFDPEPEPDAETPADDPDAEAIEITDDEVVGTDPDADPAADDPAFEAEFPPDIDLEARPEPVDGEPWSDAGLLGTTADTGNDWAAYDYAPPMDDLFAMDGAAAGGGWDSLTGSDDPAVSSLARWWQPT